MCSKKRYLKRNISREAQLLNELPEKDAPWDGASVVSAGKLRKLWDFLSELCNSLCERRLERTVLRPAYLPVTTAQFTQFFRRVWRQTVQSLSLSESVKGALQTGLWFKAVKTKIGCFRRARKIMKSDYYLRHACLSIRLLASVSVRLRRTRLPLEGFSRNLISEYFSKMSLKFH